MLFENLGIMPPILKALKDEGYTHPTPIQGKSIPILLEGRDIQGCAQTGTGKTAAFAIPILQRLALSQPSRARTKPIRALILAPTRELAIQIGESFTSYGRYLELTASVIFGGVGQGPQVEALRRGVDILVATPGRLIDLKQQGLLSLEGLELFVLDEADRMLDMGFIHDVRKILPWLPPKRQSLLFSATMPDSVQALARSIVHNPSYVEVTPVASTAETIAQQLYYVEKDKKRDLLLHLLKDKSLKSVLLFTRTKHGADRVSRLLERENIKAAAIHGNKSQNARQRALTDFKSGRLRVLVATDIAARGIDIDELELVINYEIPNIPETYVHRIGRTGRAGLAGRAISLCDEEERPYIRDIHKLTRTAIPVVEEHPFLSARGVEPAEILLAPPRKAAPMVPSRGGNPKAFPKRSGNPYRGRGYSGKAT